MWIKFNKFHAPSQYESKVPILAGFEVELALAYFTMTAMRVGRKICSDTKREHHHAVTQFVNQVRMTTLNNFHRYTLNLRKATKQSFWHTVRRMAILRITRQTRSSRGTERFRRAFRSYRRGRHTSYVTRRNVKVPKSST
jgi:hypothetical protein